MFEPAAHLAGQRDQFLDQVTGLVEEDPRLQALWLQGSLATGTADPLSDIDAYVAVDDAALEAVYHEREALLGRLGRVLAWSDGTTPGLRAVHALLAGPVKLDLFFEPVSAVGAQARPAVQVLVDKADVASALRLGWEAPRATIARILDVILRMTRQGTLWPIRLLHRGQWSTIAMMELDLINAQLAQLLALQRDPGHYYTNPFSLPRLLSPHQQAVLDDLTAEALTALHQRDLVALQAVHLRVYDGLVREGRAAAEALGIPYPITAAADAELRDLLVAEWPRHIPAP
jgi:hypothetical protein